MTPGAAAGTAIAVGGTGAVGGKDVAVGGTGAGGTLVAVGGIDVAVGSTRVGVGGTDVGVGGVAHALKKNSARVNTKRNVRGFCLFIGVPPSCVGVIEYWDLNPTGFGWLKSGRCLFVVDLHLLNRIA